MEKVLDEIVAAISWNSLVALVIQLSPWTETCRSEYPLPVIR